MKYIRQLLIILLICFFGELIHTIFKLSLPGNVIGMLLLLILLCTGIIKLEMIEETSKFLLDHLSIFFIPAGVGLISCINILKSNVISLSIIILISTIVVMISTGLTVELLMRRTKK